MKKMIRLDLSNDQKNALTPFFSKINELNPKGGAGMLVAQVWPDGMVVKVIHGKQGKALAAALGGRYDERMISSSREKMPD